MFAEIFKSNANGAGESECDPITCLHWRSVRLTLKTVKALAYALELTTPPLDMIYGVLIINKSGQPRLIKFYTALDMAAQQSLIHQVHDILSQRAPNQCNFLTPPAMLAVDDGDDIKVIYRQYATLNFVFIVDQQESELGILDIIQVFVESLNRCFEDVCELDLVFGWEVLETVLEEIIQGGMILETSVKNIVAAVDAANKTNNLNSQDALANATRALNNATSMFRSYFPQTGERKF